MALPVRRMTNLAPWDPFRDMGDLHARMSQVLDSAFGEAGLPTPQRWAPPVDIEETDEAFVVEADLPGVDRKDITVDLDGNELSVHGEITEDRKSTRLNSSHVAISYAVFCLKKKRRRRIRIDRRG